MSPQNTAPAQRLAWYLSPVWAVLLSACASSVAVPQSQTPERLPQAFKQGPLVLASAAPAPAAWWTVYADPVLDALVERANRGNTDIQLAASRLVHARAQARQADAAQLPQLSLAAGAVRQQGPLLNAAGQEGTLLSASATLSYEVDVLGRLAQAGDAAALDAQSHQALLESARLVTQAQVVQTYLALRALDQDRELLRQSLALDRQSLRIQAVRLQSGAISELEYERARGAATALTGERQVLQQRRAEWENALAVLLGEAASDFQLPSRTEPLDSRPVPLVAAGLPAAVLARRPDVAAAQKSLQAAQQRLGLSQSAWFPSFSLTGTGGFASPELSNLFSASMQTWAFGALAHLALYDGGRRQAEVAMADAHVSAAQASFQQHWLQALREVEDQLSAQRLLAQQSDALERAWGNAQRSAELSATRFHSGSISQLEWLAAQRHELQSRRQLLQLQAARYQATVALVRALGGGWN